MLGFTFNSKRCSEYGIVMSSKNRQLLPSVNDQYKEISSMAGSYLFSGPFNDRYIEIDCSFVSSSLPGLRQKARQIAAWLYTPARAKLIFDDEPGVFYWAKLSNQVDLDQTIRLGRFTLQFRCLPYAYSVSSVVVEQEFFNGETLTLTNSGTANIPIKVEVTNVEGYTFPALGTGVCPDNSLSSLEQGFSLTLNREECKYIGLIDEGKTVYIDTDRMTVQLDGINALRYHDGAFPELVVGDNSLVYSSPNGSRANVKITYTERWL